MMKNAREVEIPLFINPHLFWIFEKCNNLTRIQLEKELLKEYENRLSATDEFELGEVVVVKYGKTFMRAKIEQVFMVDKICYEIWLLDYGILFETQTVYKMLPKFDSYSILTKQASLQGLAYIDEILDLEQGSQKITSIQATLRSRTEAMELIERAPHVYFVQNTEQDDVFYGDLYYQDGAQLISLSEKLVEKGVLVKDSRLFLEIQKTRTSDLDSHLPMMRCFSKKHKILGYSDMEGYLKIEPSTTMPRRSTDESKSSSKSNKSESESESFQSAKESNTSKFLKLYVSKKRAAAKQNSPIANDKKDDTSVASVTEDNHSCRLSKSDLMKKLSKKRTPVECESEIESRPGDDIENLSVNESNVSDVSKPNHLKNTKQVIFTPAGLTTPIRTKTTKKPNKKTEGNARNRCSSEYSSSKRQKMSEDDFDSCDSPSQNQNTSTECINKDLKNETEEVNALTKKHLKDNSIVVKPFCACKNCNYWTEWDDWGNEAELCANEQVDKKILDIMRPNSLFRTATSPKVNYIEGIEYCTMTKLEKQSAFQLLVHGTFIPTAIYRLNQAYFHSSIILALKKLEYERPKKLQSYIWPAIMRGINVCYVNIQQSGKTLAYLAPISSFMVDRHDRYKELSKFNGPIVIILCQNSKQIEDVCCFMEKIFSNVSKNKPKILEMSYPPSSAYMKYVDVLITLPPILLDLLKSRKINLKRLCHLVLEDADILLNKYESDMDKIVKSVEDMLVHRVCTKEVQTIMSARHWTLSMEKFCKNLYNVPLICLGDYLEGAIYGRTKLKIQPIPQDTKVDVTINILKDNKFHKSIVVCNTEVEVKTLKKALTLNGISHICLLFEFEKEDIFTQELTWERSKIGDRPVLVCTDRMLHQHLSITSATLLINFSLPGTWSDNTKRFACLLESCRSPLVESKEKLQSEAYILADETCEEKLPAFMNLLENYNISLKNEFTTYLQQHKLKKELRNITENIPFCKRLRLFGECVRKHCNWRHILDRILDQDYDLPSIGHVKFKVVEVKNVNYFSALLIHCKQPKRLLNSKQLTELMKTKKENASNIFKGGFYAFLDPDDFDENIIACEVLDIDQSKINIKIVESGVEQIVSNSCLYDLPDSINYSPEKPVDVVVANFRPPYKDENFSYRALFRVRDIIEKVDFENAIFVAEICLSLKGTIWVKDVFEEVQLPDLRVYKQNFTKNLTHLGLAEVNLNHMTNLYALCKEAEIPLPDFNKHVSKIVKSAEDQITPSWAFLEEDACNKVVFASAISPDEVYLRLEKFSLLLSSLEKDIEECVRRQKTKTDIKVSIGKFYLGKEPTDGKFSRVCVKNIENGEVLCLAVDYGDEFKIPVEDLRILPNFLITKLPFQAILCRLYGTQAIDGEWSDQATDMLYDCYLEPETDYCRTLNVKTCEIEKGYFPGQNKYAILVKDNQSLKPMLINKLLIDCGLAMVCKGEEIVDFEIPPEPLCYERDEEMEELMDFIDLTNKAAGSNNMKQKQLLGNQDVDFNFNDFEFPIFDVERFTMDLLNSRNYHDTEKKPQQELPTLTTTPSVSYFSPELYWSQTEEELKLRIKITDVKEYTIRISRGRMLHFETKIEEKTYKVNLIFYEDVEKEFKEEVLGPEVRFTFKKVDDLIWPRLISHMKRMRNVHYELGRNQLEDEKHKKFLDLGEIDDDSWSDDDDGPMVEFVSDLESEYDMDLNSDSD